MSESAEKAEQNHIENENSENESDDSSTNETRATVGSGEKMDTFDSEEEEIVSNKVGIEDLFHPVDIGKDNEGKVLPNSASPLLEHIENIENPIGDVSQEPVPTGSNDEERGDGEEDDEDEEKNGSFEKFVKSCNFYLFMYLIDWIVAFLIYGCFGWLLVHTVDPHERVLPKTWVNETQWGYPLKDETFPDYSVVLFTLIPLVSIIVAQPFYIYLYKSCLDFHHGMLTFVVCMTFEFTTVGIVKIMAGSQRPNYKELCEADESGDCQKDISNGAKSFPSGHASSIFVQMLFTSLYISGKLGVFSERGSSFWKYVLSFLPMIIAILVAVSRTWDYYHRFIDITAGALLGMICAIMSYLLYYHSLLSDKSHHPKDRYKEFSKEKCSWKFLIKVLLR